MSNYTELEDNSEPGKPQGVPTKAQSWDTVGSVATVVLITKDKFYCANAGDCRAILVKKKGSKDEDEKEDKKLKESELVLQNEEDLNLVPYKVVALSSDHKPQNAKETLRIKAAGHNVRFNRVDSTLAIPRAIGDFLYKNKPELKPYHHS